ncbi:MAG: GNAT family N-acetyltransferase [Actinomycetota bacterium]|nr:GNAT family N-acetyltransferase [Actinomycetota bacterium]
METLADVVVERSRKGVAVVLAPLHAAHLDELWLLFADVVATGDGYPQVPPLTRAAFEDVWVRPVSAVVGAVVDGHLAGAYYLKTNGPGLGAHIANAGYVVDRRSRGQGIGRLLVADSVARAPLVGFDAVQFNFVFASNPARAMYEELGWEVVGRIPDAVVRPGRPVEDAVIYWRRVAHLRPSPQV